MKYGVRLCGSNYEIDWEDKGESALYGFVTTRFVKARNAKEAEEKAIRMITSDQSLNRMMISNSKATAWIAVTEMWEEKWWKRTGGKGYAFYPMDDEDQDQE